MRDPSHVRAYTLGQWRQALTAAGLQTTVYATDQTRLDFASWVARSQTPAAVVDQLRTMLEHPPPGAAETFAITAEPALAFSLLRVVLVGVVPPT